MNKLYFLLIFIALLSSNVHAQLATFDATNAANMIKQIEETTKLINNAESQLDELTKLEDNLSGNLGRATGLTDKVNDIRRKYDRLTRSVSKINLEGGKVPDLSNILDIRTTLDHIYDPTPLNRLNKQNMQYKHRQKTHKSALEAAELTVNNIEDNLSVLDDLIKEADETETLKDSQDLNNKILLALLSNQIELKHLVAQLTRAEVSQTYEGIDSDTQYTDESSYPDRITQSSGVTWGDPDNIPCPDIMKTHNAC